MVKWMAEEGMAPDWLINYDWVTGFDTSRVTQEEVDRVEREFSAFFMTKTKAELFKRSLETNIMLVPVNTVEDLYHFEHLRERHYWVEVEHEELADTLSYCGPLTNKLSGTPGRIRRRAPLIGEHNLEIYDKEMGFSRQELQILEDSGVI
jgi:crotonobetainyl-CoA:carnitine CoA-transferase CaiB-like acyl-CoA transferase